MTTIGRECSSRSKPRSPTTRRTRPSSASSGPTARSAGSRPVPISCATLPARRSGWSARPTTSPSASSCSPPSAPPAPRPRARASGSSCSPPRARSCRDRLQPGTTLVRLAEILTPRIADWCRIDLLDGEGELVRGLAYHADPERTRVATTAVNRLVGRSETVGSMAWCIRTGGSYTVNHDSPEGFAATDDPALLEFARTIGMRSLSITPLIARGRTLGALAVLQAESGRAISADDAALLGDIAGRAALALDNARLYSEAEAARQQAERAQPRQGRVPGDARPRAAQPAGADRHHAQADGGCGTTAMFQRERRLIERQVRNLAAWSTTCSTSPASPAATSSAQGAGRPRRGAGARRRDRRPAVREPPPRAAHHAAAATWCLDADPGRLNQVFANLLTNAARYTARGRADRGGRDASEGGACVDQRQRQRPGHRGRAAAAHLRSVRAGRPGPRSRQRRPRPRPGAGQEPGRPARRQRRGAQRRAGPRQRVHGDAAARRRRGGERRRAPPRQGADAGAAPARRERVLVIDDNHDAVEALAALPRARATATSATPPTPLDGLARLEAFAPTVAILDIGLPGIDGYELARADPRQRRRPTHAG